MLRFARDRNMAACQRGAAPNYRCSGCL